MDIFTLKGLIDELNDNAKNSIINKIYHYENELFFRLFGSKNKKNLYINISPSNQVILLSDKKFSSLTQAPSGFCMILRKYLQNRKIEAFSLVDFYRILKIEISDYFLIIKFTGKSSDIILTDNQFNVIYSLKEKNKLKKFEIPEVKLINNFDEFKETKKIEGLPPFALKEIEFLKNNFGIKEAYNFYKKLINFEIPLKPVKTGEKFYPFPLEHLGNDYVEFNNFMEIFEIDLNIKNEILKNLKERLKRANKALEKIQKEIEEKEEYEKYFKFGELIKSNLHKITGREDEIEVFDYYENKNIKIKLDKNLTPAENMEKFFKTGKKFKRAIDKLKERENVIQNEIKYLNEMIFFVENCEDLNELKEIYNELFPEKDKTPIQKSKPYKEFFYNNTKILVGKSAKGNDFIIRNFKNPEFVWCHAKNVPGAHVVILKEFDKIDNDSLQFACKLALKNSFAKNDLKGDVIYTKMKYLKKPKNAYPGQVVVTKENVLNVKL